MQTINFLMVDGDVRGRIKCSIAGNSIVADTYLDLAEDMAKRNIPMTMSDWETRLNEFLRFTADREVLQDNGKVIRNSKDTRRNRIRKIPHNTRPPF